MKSFRIVLMMLFGLICPTAFAQTAYDYELDESRPLITDVSQLSSPYSEPELDEGYLEYLLDDDPETYWHSNWHSTAQPHVHYLQIELAEPVDELISMKFTRRWHNYRRTALHYTDHVTVWSICGSDEPDADNGDWVELLVTETPFHEPGETLNTIGFDTKGKKYLRIYADATTDNRGYWHLAELQFYPCTLADEVTAAKRELIDTYFQYESFIDEFMNNAGTLAGQYLPEAVSAFVAAMDKVNEMDSSGEEYSAEEIRAMIEEIKNTYQAVLDSKVPFTLADGYYRLRHSVVFLNNVPTGEVDGDGNPITVQREVNKYMYSTLRDGKIIARWNTPADLNTDCPSLWKVTNKEGLFDIVNCATDARFDAWNSTVLTMSKESENLIAVELVENVNGEPFVTLRVSTQDARCFFHPIGHGISGVDANGTGVEGDMIGWANDASRVSEWVFEPVSDDVAEEIIKAYEPYKNRAVLIESFQKMREDATKKLEIAKDISYKEPLITSASQLSSPWSAPHSYEGNIAHLTDNDPITYWHSNWNNNTDRQYVQIELNEAQYELICMKFTRRLYNYNSTVLCTTNHVTEWSFYGSDDPDAAEEDWEQLAFFETPYNAPGETIVTDGFDPKGKKYLRLYCEANISSNRCWHLAELQLYPSPIEIVDPATSQYHMMGNVGTTLDAVLTELADVDAQDVTVEQYDKLKQAYEAFIAKFVDPTELRNKIEEVKGADKEVVIGNNPGFWKDDSASNGLKTAISNAEAYDKGGVYTTEQSQAQIEALDVAVTNINLLANPVRTDKWYRIRFGTEEEYDKYGWAKAGNAPNYWTEDGEVLGLYNEGNFGMHIAVAMRENVVLGQNAAGNNVNGNLIQPIDKDDVLMGQELHGIRLEKLTDPDMALFRFVNVGDSALAIQNKATGLFIGNNIKLSVHPALFEQVISGYGQNAFFIKSIQGKEFSPLHLAQNQSVLCAWGNKAGAGWTDADGRRGSFFIEEAEGLAADYTFGDFKINFTPGDIYGRCFPVPIKVEDPTQGDVWTVAGIERTPGESSANEEIKITLAMITDPIIAAGRPFLYVAAGEFYEDEPDDPLPSDFSFTFDLINEPQTDGYLKGVFDNRTIPEKYIAVGSGHDQKALAFKEKGNNVEDNKVYITDIDSEAGEFARNAKLVIEFNADIDDGVNTALAKVTKRGGVYTLDGRLISKNGNISSLKNAQPGIYIVNGVKVVVK